MRDLHVLQGLGSVLLFLAPGLGLAALLLGPRVRAAFRLACAYLLGLAWVAGGLYLLSHLLSVPIRRTTVLVLIGIPVLAGLVAALRGRPPRLYARRGSRLVAAAGAAAAFVSLGVFAEALTQPATDWDGVMTWVAQARFVRAARTADAPVLSDLRSFVSHPRYPLLLPLAQVAALETFSTDDDRAFRPLYAAFFPVALALVFAAAAQVAGRRAAGWAVIVAAALPAFALANGGASGCYSDLPLACFGGAALVLLTGRTLTRGEALAAGALLAATILSKTEGVYFAGFVLAAAAFARRGRGRRLLSAGLVALAAMVFFVFWRAKMSPRFDESYVSILRSGTTWIRAPRRLASAVPVLFRTMGGRDDWGWFFFGVPLVVLAGAKALRRRPVIALLIAAAGPIGVALAAYAVHFDPPVLAGSTWTRFLIQASIPLAAVLAACAREAARKREPTEPQTTAASS